MSDIKIRNVDSSIVSKLDELAKKKKLSREEYLRRQLLQMTTLPEINQIEEKYRNLVDSLMEQLKKNSEIMEVNSMVLEYFINSGISDEKNNILNMEWFYHDKKMHSNNRNK